MTFVDTVDQRGGAMIAGFEACYLYAYPDPGTGGEPWTIGIGATKFDGQGGVKRGDRITFDRAVARFKETIDRKYTPQVVHALGMLPQHKLNAGVSFHYNTGAIVSGTIDDKLRIGSEAAALRTWAAYVKAGGRVMKGLETRRAEELRLWRTGAYTRRLILVRDAQGGKRYIAPENFPWRVTAPSPAITMDRPVLPPMPQKRPRENFLLDLINYIRESLGWI